MDEFELELKNGFLEEARQILTDAERCFLALETDPSDSSLLEQIFRLAHNLKGSSKAVGFGDLGDFTHELESFLLKLKNRELDVSPASISLLLRSNDLLNQAVEALRADLPAKVDFSVLLVEIQAMREGRTATPAGKSTAEAPGAETQVEIEEPLVDIPSEQDAAWARSEEWVAAPAAATPAAPSIEAAPAAPTGSTGAGGHSAPKNAGAQAAPADETIRVSLARLERLMNSVGEMVILQTVLREQVFSGNPLLLRKTVHQIGKVTQEVQDISLSLRMVPLKQTFQKMQRIVRDTSNALGKRVAIQMEGEDTEVDKTVLEQLGDPLVHLIRNAVDHGIESAEKRLAAGKSESGTVLLRALHQGGSLVIEVRDDGAGLDPARLKAKAIEKGVITEKQAQTMSDADAHLLIFAPGFSTKTEVTDVSGRGVGMDVVRTNIEALSGEIHIETVIGQGTCFKVRLPLTLAIIDGMIVQNGNDRFVIPLSHVHESLRPARGDVHEVTGMGEVLSLRGEQLPLYRLSHLLGRRETSRHASDCIALVNRTGKQPLAIVVDDILGQHQVVIKQLGQEHAGLKGFSGSSILGDGRPALILELSELVKGFKGAPAAPARAQTPTTIPASKQKETAA